MLLELRSLYCEALLSDLECPKDSPPKSHNTKGRHCSLVLPVSPLFDKHSHSPLLPSVLPSGFLLETWRCEGPKLNYKFEISPN